MRYIIAAWLRIESFNRLIYHIGAAFILILGLITLIDVGGRFIFSRSLQGTLEMSELTMVIIIFLCWGYAFSLNAHIKVDALTLRFPPRVQIIFDVITSTLTLAFLALVLWRGTCMAIQQRINYTDVLHIPIFPLAMLIPFGSALAGFSLMGHIASRVHALIKTDSVEHSEISR